MPVFLFFSLCAGVVAAESANGEVTLVTPEGDEQRHTLKGLSETELQLELGAVPLKDVAVIVFAPRPAPSTEGTAMHLRNGDVLCNAAPIAGDEAKLTFKGGALGEVKLDYKFLAAVTFAGKELPAADALEAFLKAPPPKEDQLLTAKGETVSGYLEKFTGKDLSFNSGGQSRAYPYEQLAAFRFAPLEEYKPRAELRGAIELRDGSRVTGKLLELTEGKLKFEALNGQIWALAVETLSNIAFKGGKLVYLSELAPSLAEEKPYVGGMPVVYRWQRDRSALGTRMIIAAKPYERGLGVHSFARLEYDLAGQYAKFLSDVGLDDAAAGGLCDWKVLLDGKEAAAGTAKPGRKAEALRLDLKGVQQLALICDYGPDDSDAGDCLDWAGARLLKP
ncbi:MAG: NPCBM/NEW2 domain-containing protein [Planctomycetota bacterium]